MFALKYVAHLVDLCPFLSEKSVAERSSESQMWELIEPVPLNEDGSSIDAVLGRNPEVHYIYVCTKVCWQEPSLTCGFCFFCVLIEA